MTISRFSVLDNPNAHPGKCCVCGSAGGGGRKFVDFGMQLDVYGAVYFCSECVAELAASLNFIPSKKHDEACRGKENAETVLESLRGDFEEYRNAVRSILNHCNCDARNASGSNDDPLPENDENAEERSSGSDGETPVDSSVEELSDVPSNASGGKSSRRSKVSSS